MTSDDVAADMEDAAQSYVQSPTYVEASNICGTFGACDVDNVVDATATSLRLQ
jgi:hypothetical protein